MAKLNQSAKDMLERIQYDVANFIMDALGLNNRECQRNGTYWEGITFGDVMFQYDKLAIVGDIEIRPMPGDRFWIELHRSVRDTVVVVWSKNIDGSELEDLFIELADI